MTAEPTRPRDMFPGLQAHRLTRVLTRVTSLEAVCELLLRAVVRVVPSRLGAVAVPAGENSLRVVATHGYPLELVKHIRIPAGVGVIGSVFATRSPICVADVASLGTARRRARYRTDSFVAVPIVAGREVLGVICVTDREHDELFSSTDVAAIRSLTLPAALAIGRERQREEAERLAQAAVIDPLSGLYNRRYLTDRLSEELHRSHRDDSTVGLLLMDVDDFKAVNDRYGHLAGDAVIRGISGILRQSVRIFDVCSRFGGDEFAVVLPGTGPEGAAILAERIRDRIAAYTLREHTGHVRVTVSVGWATAGRTDPQTLFDAADRALYAAKHAGKNRVSAADDDGRT